MPGEPERAFVGRKCAPEPRECRALERNTTLSERNSMLFEVTECSRSVIEQRKVTPERPAHASTTLDLQRCYRIRMRKILVAILSWAIFACANAEPVAAVAPKPYLAPYPGSRVTSAAGVDGIAYEIDEPYPAERVLRFIKSRVPAEFRPRAEDFMNPGIPTSHVRGWTSYEDGTTQPSSSVHQWQAEWEDAAGNILTYSLQYRSAGDHLDRPTSTKLRVSGTLLTRAQADAMPRSAPPPPTSPAAAQPQRVANADYVVLRPLQQKPFDGALHADLSGETFYFADRDVILDLRDLDLDSAEVSEAHAGKYGVRLPTNTPGDEKLKTWTSANVGRQLGIFVGGRLITAPWIRTPISGLVYLDDVFSKDEAAKVVERVKRGGA